MKRRDEVDWTDGWSIKLRRKANASMIEEKRSNLGVLSRNPVKNSLVGAVSISALLSGLFIVLISWIEALRAEVPSVAERFVDALEGVPTGHENLAVGELFVHL